MKPKIGIYVNQIEFSQLFLCLFDELKQLRDKADVVLFYNDTGKHISASPVASMHASNLWLYDGSVISTDRLTTMFLKNIPMIKDKYFYIWNLEWLYQPKSMEYNSEVYDINLIFRSKEHKNLFNDVWANDQCDIVEDFNHEQILQLIG